jgi:hypothetical protein
VHITIDSTHFDKIKQKRKEEPWRVGQLPVRAASFTRQANNENSKVQGAVSERKELLIRHRGR